MAMAKHWTNKYARVPFLDHGRSMKGVDCYGLLVLVYQDIYDITLPPFDMHYENVDDKQNIVNAMASAEHNWVPVIPGTEREGDVIILKLDGWPVHLGIIVAPNSMMHIERGSNVVVEKYRNIKWERRTVGFFRHKELANV